MGVEKLGNAGNSELSKPRELSRVTRLLANSISQRRPLKLARCRVRGVK